MKIRRILLGLFVLLLVAAGAGAAWVKLTEPRLADLPPLHNGDVLFQSARSDQALAIFLATRSLYTHVGIVEKDPDGKIYVIQAANVVVKTPLAAWIKQSYGERLTITRFRGLNADNAARIVHAAEKFEGTPYDFFFRMAPDQIYCSELIYHAFQNGAGISLGKLQPIGSLGIDNFAVRRIIKSRWRLDPDCQAKAMDFNACYAIIKRRLIITPVSLSRDAKLQTLYNNY